MVDWARRWLKLNHWRAHDDVIRERSTAPESVGANRCEPTIRHRTQGPVAMGTSGRSTLSLCTEFVSPTPPVQRWCCLFRQLQKADVPVGTEIWYDEAVIR